jgi:DNA primase
VSAARWVSYRAVKQAISIDQVLEHYGRPFARRGDRLEAACPIHGGESRRQLKVSLAKGAFKCFGCGAGGNVLDLVAGAEGVSIREAALLLVEWFALEGTEATRRPARAIAPAGTPRRREAARAAAHRNP